MSNSSDKQNDLYIENASGYQVRTQINDALEAIAKNSTGSTAPIWGPTSVTGVAPTEPAINQFWADTSVTPTVLRIYDGTNWHQVRSIEEYDNDPKSRGVYTHTGNLFKITGTGALNLPSGTTGQRPTADAAAGSLRWNNELDRVEVYDGSNWGEVTTATVADGSIDTQHIADGAITPEKLSAIGAVNDYRFWFGIGACAVNTQTIKNHLYGPLYESEGSSYVSHSADPYINSVFNNKINSPIGVGTRNPAPFIRNGATPILTRSGDLWAVGTANTTHRYGTTNFAFGHPNSTQRPFAHRAILRGDRNFQRYFRATQPSGNNLDGYSGYRLSDNNVASSYASDTNFTINHGDINPPGTYETWGNEIAYQREGIVDCAWSRLDWHYITNLGNLYYSGEDLYGGSGDGTQSASYRRRGARPVKLWKGSASSNSELEPAYYPRFTFITNARMPGGNMPYNTTYPSAHSYVSNSYYAIDNDGRLWAWGANDYGQLGNGTTTTTFKPLMVDFNVPVQPEIVYVCASGGLYASVHAIDAAGSIYVWGYNQDGALGDGTTTDRLSPYCLTNDSNNPLHNKLISHVIGGLGRHHYDVSNSAGAAAHNNNGHTFFLTEDGEVFACGYSEDHGKYTGCHDVNATRTITYPELVNNSYENGTSATDGGRGMLDRPGEPLGNSANRARRVFQLFVTGGRYSCAYAVCKSWNPTNPDANILPYNIPAIVYSWGSNDSGQLGRTTATAPSAGSLGDFLPQPIKFRDYGVTTHQGTGHSTYHEIEGFNMEPTFKADGAIGNGTSLTADVRFYSSIQWIGGNMNLTGTVGTVVLVTGSGQMFYAGSDDGSMCPGLEVDSDNAEDFATGTTANFADRFTPIMTAPEPCKEFLFITDASQGINYLMNGVSGMTYFTGDNDTGYYNFDRNSNSTGDYSYMQPLHDFVKH